MPRLPTVEELPDEDFDYIYRLVVENGMSIEAATREYHLRRAYMPLRDEIGGITDEEYKQLLEWLYDRLPYGAALANLAARHYNGEKWWGTWNDYPKKVFDGHTYAMINGRPYSRHALDRLQPSRFKYDNEHTVDIGKKSSYIIPMGGDPKHSYGRSIPPEYIEYVIQNGAWWRQPKGTIEYSIGDVEVITNHIGAVVTVRYEHKEGEELIWNSIMNTES